MPNPFVIGSGPPGTNLNVITRAFREGWGAVIAKTVSLDSSKVVNVTPRYGKLHSADRQEVIGWENIELISDRPFKIWLDEFKKCKDQFPDGVLIASIMEEYNQRRVDRDRGTLPGCGRRFVRTEFLLSARIARAQDGRGYGRESRDRRRGLRLGDESGEETGVGENDAERYAHRGSEPGGSRGGCQGVSAINTIRSVMAVNLETLRPEPSVEGFTTPGGYSSKAVRPIALRMVMEIATMIRREFPGRSLSGIGGIETGRDAAQFILLGADTTQVCTGVMKFGYECVKQMCDELLAFMEKHKFETLADFKGKSLDYFTTHAELVRMQGERKAKQKAAADAAAAKKMVKADGEWSGDDFVKQSDALARG